MGHLGHLGHPMKKWVTRVGHPNNRLMDVRSPPGSRPVKARRVQALSYFCFMDVKNLLGSRMLNTHTHTQTSYRHKRITNTTDVPRYLGTLGT